MSIRRLLIVILLSLIIYPCASTSKDGYDDTAILRIQAYKNKAVDDFTSDTDVHFSIIQTLQGINGDSVAEIKNGSSVDLNDYLSTYLGSLNESNADSFPAVFSYRLESKAINDTFDISFEFSPFRSDDEQSVINAKYALKNVTEPRYSDGTSSWKITEVHTHYDRLGAVGYREGHWYEFNVSNGQIISSLDTTQSGVNAEIRTSVQATMRDGYDNSWAFRECNLDPPSSKRQVWIARGAVGMIISNDEYASAPNSTYTANVIAKVTVR